MKRWLFALGAAGLIGPWPGRRAAVGDPQADFMYKTGTIKRLPDKWSDLFFSETAQLNGS